MAKRKKGPSKVGTVIKIKAYERKVGKLPGRTKAGRFSKTTRAAAPSNQAGLFKK